MRVVSLSWMDVVAVVAALVLCGLIGFEREARRKDAGIRTHILVGLGSCLFTMVSIEGVPAVVGASVTWDASRIAAQVVTGIGFLGAGMIFFNHDTIRGLTTACAIWIAAAERRPLIESSTATQYGIISAPIPSSFPAAR